MKRSTLNQIQGVLVTAGRTDLAKEINANTTPISNVLKAVTKTLKDSGHEIKDKTKFNKEFIKLVEKYRWPF